MSQDGPIIQLLTDLKYDHYQGFRPASKFHIALINWIGQFEKLEERRVAYNFLKNQLIFISQKEMHHLVGLMMPTIDRLMRKKIARDESIHFYQTWLNEKAEERLEIYRRKTLFVGLSDGARIDVFRRYNEGKISNEQVVPYSEISERKWMDLTEKELANWITKNNVKSPPLFEAVCLVDDFSGSGSSLIRKDAISGDWKGKVAKFCEDNLSRIGRFLSEDCTIYIHHYLASSRAEKQIRTDIKSFAQSCPQYSFVVSFSHVLPEGITLNDQVTEKSLKDLIKIYYDPKIEDDHTGKNIWYGYKDCGLPLALHHNSPNNSIALIWAHSPKSSSSPTKIKPLFSRRKRHSSDG